MPCYKINTAPSGYGQIGTTGYATEAECLEACKEGACCNGTTCSVKPQCQCNAAAGEVFKGVGTVCSPNPCISRCCGPESVTFSCGGVTVTYVPCFNGLSESECTQKGDGWVWEQGVSCDRINSRASFSLNCLEQGVPAFECLGDCPPYSSTNPGDCCSPCNTGGIVVDVCPDGCGCNYDTGRCVKNPLP